jgi:hypothetical protein
LAKLDIQITLRSRLIGLLLIFLGSWPALSAQNLSLFDFINSLDSAELYIETNVRDLLRKKDRYQPAHIYIRSGNGIELDTMGEIRARGKMRKQYCYVPPTKIRFDKKYLQNRQWKDYPTLKIVNACALNDLSETYIELEYLLYKIYNLITEKSFKACRAVIHYLDTEEKKNPIDLPGFILEHEDQLSERLDGEIYHVSVFRSNHLDRKAFILFSVFQFMIGNTDWKVLTKHNMEVVKVHSERTFYPVPYDFDYAGVVNASYAVPHESLPIKTVTERLYLGPCQTEEEIDEICTLFLNKRVSINQLVDQYLSSSRSRRACHDYLDEFFRILENPKNARAIFMNCRS